MNDISRILERIQQGEPAAAEGLLPLVYDELRKLAAVRLAKEAPGNTLDATALVHEAYLRLVASPLRDVASRLPTASLLREQGEQPQWDNRGHFFAAAATAMRRILIERARRQKRQIHGGGRRRQELSPDLVVAKVPNEELLALDESLVKLAQHDPVKARLVELRYFAGLTGDQAAQILGLSPKTADHYWAYARAWLRREMENGDAG
jgi:RNA polymerase sigma factor (sigma-70 family)